MLVPMVLQCVLVVLVLHRPMWLHAGGVGGDGPGFGAPPTDGARPPVAPAASVVPFSALTSASPLPDVGEALATIMVMDGVGCSNATQWRCRPCGCACIRVHVINRLVWSARLGRVAACRPWCLAPLREFECVCTCVHMHVMHLWAMYQDAADFVPRRSIAWLGQQDTSRLCSAKVVCLAWPARHECVCACVHMHIMHLRTVYRDAADFVPRRSLLGLASKTLADFVPRRSSAWLGQQDTSMCALVCICVSCVFGSCTKMLRTCTAEIVCLAWPASEDTSGPSASLCTV